MDTINRNPEQRLRADIENVKLALNKLKPEPKSVLLDKEVDGDNHPHIENRGLFDIQIDRKAIDTILLACGVPVDSLHKINLEFRAASLADRNLWGQVVAGLRMDDNQGHQLIEIYTSLPHTITNTQDTAANLENTRLTHFAFTKEQIVISLLEELRHAVQFELKLFDLGEGSFDAQSVADLRKIDYEKDAEQFTQALKKNLLPFVAIKKYEIEGVSEMYVSGSEVKNEFPQTLQDYLDASMVAKVRETDPPGLYLSQSISRVDALKETDVHQLINRIGMTLESKKIGFVEARWLYQQLHDRLTSVGELIQSRIVLAQIQKIS